MLIKDILPKSLFGRALLILVLPTIFIQLLMAFVFFDRHWQNVTRYMSSALAGETAYLVSQLREAPTKEKSAVVRDFEHATGLDVALLPELAFREWPGTMEFPVYRQLLDHKIDAPFVVRRLEAEDAIEVRIALVGQTLAIRTTAKRLESPTTNIFLLWMVGSSTLLLLVAIMFLRNQLRPISRLAKAADRFGRGIDTEDFRPHGATEVRIASRAFITMRDRIKRQLRTRTDMLSGISHDLRTPLTRMKLQLAMLPENETVRGLGEDVQQMEHMIAEYLDFARGEGAEEAGESGVAELLFDIINDYQRSGQPVRYQKHAEPVLMLKSSAMRRALTNIIDNALRYGKEANITLTADAREARIRIDDAGRGIPEAMREEVFRPFARLDASRNNKTGGVGLGLTIARDIILAHGGSIELADSAQGGLSVTIRLPMGRG